jgi:hypothetical protein
MFFFFFPMKFTKSSPVIYYSFLEENNIALSYLFHCPLFAIGEGIFYIRYMHHPHMCEMMHMSNA